MERWIANYRSVGERPLTGSERGGLTRIVRRRKLLFWPVWGGWALSMPVVLALCAQYEYPPAWFAAFLVLALVLLAFVALFMRDLGRAAADALRDLEAGTVEIFEWRQPDGGEDARHVVEVFRLSSRLLAKDGRAVKGYRKVSVSEVAAAVPGRSSGLFPKRLSLVARDGRVEPTRALTVSELDELQSFCKKLGRFPYLAAFLAGTWAVLMLISALTEGVDSSSWFWPAVLGALIGLSWRQRFKLVKLRAQIEKDIVGASVEQKAPEKYPHAPGIKLPNVVEVLPHSNAIWTVDGEPAGWRKTV